MTPAARAAWPARILLFVDNFDVGGTQNQFVKLANALSTDGRFEVHVGCLRRNGALTSELRVPPDRIKDFPLRRFYDTHGLRQITRLARYVSSHKFDVVHAHDFYADVMCTAAACLTKTRLIVGRRYLKLTDRALHAFGERWSYRLADAVVLNSKRVADDLIRDGVLPPSKATVIHNGLDLQQYQHWQRPTAADSGPTSHAPRIGVVASLRQVKGHEVLIRATETLRARWPHLEVILVGEGHLRPQLEALTNNLDLADTVRFVGEQADVRPWLQTFDVAVLPSWYEGFPNALLEYLAMGRPVVATAVGAIPEVVEHEKEAVLVPPGDVQALASAIDGLLAHEPRRAALAAAGLLRVQHFSVDRMVEHYCDLYERLLAERAPLGPFRRPIRAIPEMLGGRPAR